MHLQIRQLKQLTRKQIKRVKSAALLLVLVVLMLVPSVVSFAQTNTPVPPTAVPPTAAVSLEIDMNPLFEAINSYFPIMFGIFAVAGGITIAMVLARFLINAIKGAFEGKNL